MLCYYPPDVREMFVGCGDERSVGLVDAGLSWLPRGPSLARSLLSSTPCGLCPGRVMGEREKLLIRGSSI